MDERRLNFAADDAFASLRAVGGPAPTQAGAPAPLRLVLVAENRTIEIATAGAVIGRHSQADVRLPYADVSRRHCRLACEDGLWRVRDLDSLNGVFVNDERVHETTLVAGDCLRIGQATLIVRSTPATNPVLRSISAALVSAA